MFLQQAQPGKQERSAQSLTPQFGADANDADLTHRTLALSVRNLLDLALAECPKPLAWPYNDQVERGLIGTGLMIVHSHAHAIKHGLVQFLVGIEF